MTGKCKTFRKQTGKHSWCPVISFSTIPESLTAVPMVWLAKLHVFFTRCVGYVGSSVVSKCNATETRRAKRQERLPVLGSSVSSTKHYMAQLQDLVANQMSVCGCRQLRQQRHSANVSAKEQSHKVSWIETSFKCAVAGDRLVFFSQCTACDRAR